MTPSDRVEHTSKKTTRDQALLQRDDFHRNINPLMRSQLTTNLKNGIKKLRTTDGIWLGYRAVRSEADPRSAITDLGGAWAFPKVNGKNIDFYLVRQDSSWVPGAFGIPEPDPNDSTKININQAEGVLVPGLRFDRKGNRVGSGLGFYDKALAIFKGVKVGVAYSIQVRDQDLPTEPHDIRMDFIATEKEFSAVKKD